MVAGALAGCRGERDGQAESAAAAGGARPAMGLTIRSGAFEPGSPIPHRYTGDGQDVSPPLEWTGLPEAARSLALICDDPDAPTPEPWVHWVIYDLPPQTASLPEGVPAEPRLTSPVRALQGRNSWGTVGYRGPAPPLGHGTHRYHFRLYVLDDRPTLEPGLTKNRLLAAIDEHIIATAEVVGLYHR